MKKAIALLFIGALLSLNACSTEEEIKLNPEPNNPDDEEIITNPDFQFQFENQTFKSDSVSSQLEKENIEVITYQTALDTTLSHEKIDIAWSAFFDNGDSLLIDLKYPQIKESKSFYSKRWIQSAQKWLATFGISLSPASNKGDFKIDLKLTRQKAKKVILRTKELSISQTTKKYDIFHVNFGMTKDEVKANESARLKVEPASLLGWVEATPNTAYIIKGSYFSKWTIFNVNPSTCYQFEEGRLAKVSEVIDPHEPMVSNSLELEKAQNFFYWLGAPTPPVYYEYPDYHFSKAPLIWQKNGLNIAFSRRVFEIPNNGSISAYSVSFEKP